MEETAVRRRDRIFAARRKDLSERIAAEKAVSNRYSNIRMALFSAALLTGILFGYLGKNSWAAASVSVFLAAFAASVIIHTGKKKKIHLHETILSVHDEYEARMLHRFDKLPDPGNDFRDKNHDFSGDLDLFGERSLYHLIATAQTWYGRRALADLLLTAGNPNKSAADILKRQAAVRELSGKLAMLQEFQAAGRLSKKSAEDPGKLLEYVRPKDGEKPLISSQFLLFSALLTLTLVSTSLLAALSDSVPAAIPVLIGVVQLIVVALNYQKFKPVFLSVEDFYSELSAYVELFEDVEKASVSSEILVGTQKVLLGDNSCPSASARVKKLHRICLFIQARSQPLLFFVLNLLFLYDNYCIYYLEKWKRESGLQLRQYMEALGVWEALMSLAALTFVYPECDFPTFTDPAGDTKAQATFRASRMGHPLIPVDRQVRNDFDLPEGIALITGSNMSGKTTLLRTVGINAVLAYTGTVCCCDSVCLGMMQIASSMRIADDLGEGLSTFYAELLRIGNIVKKARDGRPLLFLIDEIFRGTNSRDRTDGAKIVLKNLSRPWIIGIMSTHDYELCAPDTQSGFELRNYHFSETYDEEGIHFDYRLTPGISVSANARYLMRMIGIE